jgi:hypothetical protein
MLTMQRLDELAERYTSPPAAQQAIEAAPVRVQITARDARHQILGGIKIIARICGIDMTQDIYPAEMLVQRIDQLEDMVQAQRVEIERLKGANRDEIAGYKKALRNIAARLEIYRQPFENKPFSKWKNDDKGKWMLAVGETVDWAVQRADNQLDPVNAVTIAPDED